MEQSIRITCLGILLITAMAACGGGGGSDSDGSMDGDESGIVDLGSLNGRNGISSASEINNVGVVAGFSGGTELGQPFVWTANSGMREIITTVSGNPGTDIQLNNLGDIGLIVFGGVRAIGPGLPYLFTDSNTVEISDINTFFLNDLNDNRQALGCDNDPATNNLCWIWNLDATGLDGTKSYFREGFFPIELNTRGDLVATSSSGSGLVVLGIVRTAEGREISIPTFGGAGNSPADINNAGIAVGSADTTITYAAGSRALDVPLTHAFSFNSSTQTITELDTRTDVASAATAINSNGFIVGNFATITPTDGFAEIGESRPFIFHPSIGFKEITTLLPASPEWQLLTAADINDNLDVVGQGIHNGVQRGFIVNLKAALDQE